jgi:hypothetical protein
MRRILPVHVLISVMSFGAGCRHQGSVPVEQAGVPHVPVLTSEWQRVVEYPDHHLNDFCVFQDEDGYWHAMGIMGAGTWRSEQSLFHCVGRDLRAPFVMREPILTQTPPLPLAPQKHAPFVVYHGGLYHLFYRRPPGTILHLTSTRPDVWTGPGDLVFSENDARDVCIVRIGDVFHMYYCQLAEIDGVDRSCILLRRSIELNDWQEAIVVHVDTAEPADHCYLESPFVVQRREGFYLFIRHRLHDDRNLTVVLFSTRPNTFPSGREKWFAELPDGHALEIVHDRGTYYIFRVSGAPHACPSAPVRGGWLDVARLEFHDPKPMAADRISD